MVKATEKFLADAEKEVGETKLQVSALNAMNVDIESDIQAIRPSVMETITTELGPLFQLFGFRRTTIRNRMVTSLSMFR